jgi:ubiquinone/menaquinone biosynthesis C-methylase UbiE
VAVAGHLIERPAENTGGAGFGVKFATALLCLVRFVLWRISLPRTGYERKLMTHDFELAVELASKYRARSEVRRALRRLFWRDLRTLPAFAWFAPSDVLRVVRKRFGATSGPGVRPPDAFPYPSYYLYDFHHQANGNLSWRAAMTYEWQLRFLFVGCNHLMRQAVVDEIPEGQELKILDLACGTGSWVTQARLQNRNHHVTGIDLSESYLRHARRDGGFAELRQLNAEALPEDWTGRFDLVTCVWLYHELPPDAQARVTSEVARVLKPGGRLLFMDSLQWSKDTPQLFEMMGGRAIFAEVFNEPYLATYLNTDLHELFERYGIEVEAEAHCFKSKLIKATRASRPSPLPPPPSPTSG